MDQIYKMKRGLQMKKYILLLSTTLLLASCSTTEDEIENSGNEATIEQIETEEVIQLGVRERADNQVVKQYFSNLSEFPTEKATLFSDKKKNGYLLWGNGFPILGEVYFSANGLIYIDYDSKLDKIEVANILVKGATIQDVPLEENLYVSWTYDFKNLEIQDLVQVNADGETQDFIHFTEEEWEDLSNGYKESLLNIAQ